MNQSMQLGINDIMSTLSSEYILTTPVLFIIFNRPTIAHKAFQEIKKVKPKNLFIAADGPRNNEEEKLCQETREIILNDIDWDCDVKTLFSEHNLGCGIRVYTAIDWIFSYSEEAIIIEDDCITTTSFFKFCEEILGHYRYNKNIMHIGGFNFQQKQPVSEHSYYFSKYPIASGGWATWKRAWILYDWNIASWPNVRNSKTFNINYRNKHEKKLWEKIFDKMYKGANDIWDYQWTFACWLNNGMAILPSFHLIKNIGFGNDATHTKNELSCLLTDTQEITEINHPDTCKINTEADYFLFINNFGGYAVIHESSIKNKIKQFSKKIILEIIHKT